MLVDDLADRHAHCSDPCVRGVYLLEFAGDDDELAVVEAGAVGAGLEQIAPGVALAGSLEVERVRGLAFTRRASELVARSDGTIPGARAALAAAKLDRSGSVAVRASRVRDTSAVSTAEAERVLGTVLVERGFDVDLETPDQVLRVVFTGDTAAIGWQLAESARDFGERAPTDKPFFQPGSMDPHLARAVANIAGAGPDRTVLDPMCGTGGVLVEAGLVGATVLGMDAQERMVRGARENLQHYLSGRYAVGVADATRVPVADDAVDTVVFDAPYGRQSPVAAGDLEDLVAGALLEARRVADRGVVVGDRRWDQPAREAGWRVETTLHRRVHRSLTRHLHVLV